MVQIKEIREEKGLTAVQLAKKMNLDLKTIWRWENGKNNITSDNLLLLADALCCTTDELLGRENYATGNVEIIGEKLDADEKKLLGVYRALDQAGKRAFISMTENLATLHNIPLKSKIS